MTRQRAATDPHQEFARDTLAIAGLPALNEGDGEFDERHGCRLTRHISGRAGGIDELVLRTDGRVQGAPVAKRRLPIPRRGE